MPVYKFPFNSSKGNLLERRGPRIAVTVAIPEALETARLANGQQVPSPVRGMALLDTGATISAVDVRVFRQLSLAAIDQVSYNSVGGFVKSEVYPVQLAFPRLEYLRVDLKRAFACNLGWTGDGEEELLMVVGRDILKNFLFLYDGIHNEMLLSH